MIKIELNNIKRVFGKKIALNDVSFKIYEGDFVVIKGESGSGKSTLLNILGRLDIQTSGIYKFDDVIVDEINSSYFRNKNIGFVFQSYNLINGLSVKDNLMVPYIYSKNYDYNKYINNLNCYSKFLGIFDLLNNNVSDLSGGEKQRVGILRALMLEPSLILADEPTGNLDPLNKKLIVDIFLRLNKEYKKTILVVTHDNAFDMIANRHFRLCEGKSYEE